MNKAKVSIVSAVMGTLPLMTITLAILFLGESIPLTQFLLIIIIGTGLVTLGFLEKKNSTKLEWRGFLWGLIATLAFGIANVVSKFVIDQVGSASFSIINASYMLIISFIWLALNQELNLSAWQGMKTVEARIG